MISNWNLDPEEKIELLLFANQQIECLISDTSEVTLLFNRHIQMQQHAKENKNTTKKPYKIRNSKSKKTQPQKIKSKQKPKTNMNHKSDRQSKRNSQQIPLSSSGVPIWYIQSRKKQFAEMKANGDLDAVKPKRRKNKNRRQLADSSDSDSSNIFIRSTAGLDIRETDDENDGDLNTIKPTHQKNKKKRQLVDSSASD